MKNGTQDDTGSVILFNWGYQVECKYIAQQRWRTSFEITVKQECGSLAQKKKRINEKNPAPRVFICITFHTRLKIISDSLSVRLLENTNHWACREYKMINFFSLTRFWSRATGFVTSLLYGPVLQKEHV